ncbi:hypothetical protein [Amycolatopsis vastitatis]|uniref:hypothetical protein n=1 Tax=Amycolatopsis vastitatis TaxID=1905142 RepID=UPI00142D923B|nr:hypothetical protein [Amycolatopsis vastitatis]
MFGSPVCANRVRYSIIWPDGRRWAPSSGSLYVIAKRDSSSTVAALDAITTKYAGRGKTVEIVGLNADSARRPGKLSGELAGSH